MIFNPFVTVPKDVLKCNMKIAVCTRHIGSKSLTGGDRFVTHSFRALLQHDHDNQYVGYHETLGQWGLAHRLPLSMLSLLSDAVLKNTWVPLWAHRNRVDLLLHLIPPICYTESKIPQVCSIFDVPQGWEQSNLLDRTYNWLFNKWSARSANQLITISNYSKEIIMRLYAVPEAKVSVVYPCIDLDEFNPTAQMDPVQHAVLAAANAAQGYVLGVISRIIERKNPGAYFEIYARLPDEMRAKHKLVIVGAGAGLEDFKPFVPGAILDRVKQDVVFLGRVPENLAGIYARAGVVLFPSRYEGFGLPVIEAMACATPVVTSNVPAIVEASGRNIPLFNPDDLAGMAEYCKMLLDDPKTAKTTQERCSTWVQQFSYAEYARRMGVVLQACIR